MTTEECRILEKYKKELMLDVYATMEKELNLVISKQKYNETTKCEPLVQSSDICGKYYEDICKKIGAENHVSNQQSISAGIRKAVALKMGYPNTRYIKTVEEAQRYREELERFIKEYILGE